MVTGGNLDNIRDPRREESRPGRSDYDTGMNALPVLVANDFSHDPVALAEALAEALHARGVCRIAGWPDPDLRRGLREELRRLQATGALSRAAVGRSDGRALRDDIRADTTLWLDDPRCGEPARAFLAWMETLRTTLSRTLFLGLEACEAHYAAYPPGGGYARHRDRFRDSDARVVSWVSYLNDDGWRADDGGALRLYLDSTREYGTENVAADARTIELMPAGGSVCFLSELEHEVLPAMRERLSIACWMRRRAGDLP
jgi:SM-20-related protein